MAYGIGSVIGDIDQKVDTYRNKPEALAQMYQQNQQLIDLLALQKLKTEKEAAMRDMQMKMQTPAASIKDQREQEVMGMMRNEVAQQIAPGLQAAGQQAAQEAAPPVPQGGGLQSLPAPNMQGMGMAEGGIVAFAGEGSSQVKSATPIGRWWDRELEATQRITDKDAIRKQIINQYGPDAGLFGLFREQSDEQREHAKQIMRALPTLSFADALAVAATGELPAAKEVSAADNEANIAEMLGETTRPTPPQAATQPAGIPTVGPQIDEDAAYRKSLERGLPQQAGISTLPRNQAPPTMPTRDEADAIMNVSSGAVKQAPPEVQNEYTRRLSELRGEQESKLDALIAFLQGAGGKTSFAATMAGGAAGMNAREQQIKDEIMATADKIEGLKLKQQEMGVAEERNVIAREGSRLQAEASRYNADRDYDAAMAQIEASRYNADRDYDAAMAQIDATNYGNVLDYQAAMAEKAASSAKAINDAIEKQQLTTAQRLELFASFDENLVEDVRAKIIEQLEDTETPPDSPKGQQTIQDAITAARNDYVLARIGEVAQSYGQDPLFDAADAVLGE